MGFGHRIYKNFDPRSKIVKRPSTTILAHQHRADALLDIARELEDAALNDDTSSSGSCTPTSTSTPASSTQAMGFPLKMFTVMFAIGRMPGWIANWKELNDEPKSRIYRPRQIYVGTDRRAVEAPRGALSPHTSADRPLPARARRCGR